MRRGAGGDGGGESTSSSGDVEHDREWGYRECDEPGDRDFEHVSLKPDEKSESGDIFSWYVLLLSSSSDSWLFTSRLMLKFSCSAKE